MVKNLPANARDVGLIPGSGRSPGGGYATLEWSEDGKGRAGVEVGVPRAPDGD